MSDSPLANQFPDAERPDDSNSHSHSAPAVSQAAASGTRDANSATARVKTATSDAQRERRGKWNDTLIRIAFVAFLLALWQGAHYVLVTRLEAWSGALFPAPGQVFGLLWDGFGLSYLTHNYLPVAGADAPRSLGEAMLQKDYLSSIASSLGRLLVGYGIAISLGFPLGLLVARYAWAEKTIGWLSSSLQALPSICWIPLALLWLGRFGVWPVIFVTVMGALFATVIAVADGIRNVPPLLARAGRTLGAEGVRLYFGVLLPAALPGIITGLKIGWSFAWRSLMAAELIVNSGGLGFLLQRDRAYGYADGVLATILVIIVIGLSVQALIFAPLERRLQRLWGLSGVRN